MSNRLHPSVRARLFAEMRALVEIHPERSCRDALLSRLNVLKKDGEVVYQKLEDTNLQLDDEMFQDVE